ncbi:DUF2500 domain-containing protein [Cohnella faecalis]|uniref:DUF2500 domain-containing protein n=1 Tax=Cohnella faecalis TaxID=2315694 RepID=A0A398CK81_9BACL|nr:DUF2500 domain-containing protein [Cohnella faecalis]RIE03716.1 DUF2500 domain-containing protein [Cohnella faecalis]
MNPYAEPDGFFGFMSELPLFFKIFGGIVVALVAGTFLYVIVKGLSIWSSNNAASIQVRKAKVVDKRTEVWGGSGDSSANTNYYVTFEFEDGTRVELPVATKHYGLIAAGDQGTLTHQGTRFKGFDRI